MNFVKEETKLNLLSHEELSDESTKKITRIFFLGIFFFYENSIYLSYITGLLTDSIDFLFHSICKKLFTRSAWQYPDRFYVDSTIYTNLKRHSMSTSDEYVTGNQTNNGHMPNVPHISQLNQSAVCPESSLHFLNLTSSASPAHATVATTCADDTTAMIGAYQSDYGFASPHTVHHDTNIDSLTGDYMSNTNAIGNSSNTTISQFNGLNSQTINSHQRRGSLQLWQFLVALLDEPASR